jgi:hypothetical protein
MGILDDAIRDHLELKRKGGTQESDLQRLENEAFGPSSRPGDAPGAVATAEPPEGLNQQSADEGSEPDTGQASLPTTQMPAPETPEQAPPPAEQGGETDAPEGEVGFHDFAAEEGLVPPRAAAPSAPPVEQDVGRPEPEQEKREPEPSEPTTPAPAPASETSADDTQPHNVEAEFGLAESQPESPPADRAEEEEIEIADDLELHLDEEDLEASAGLEDRAEPETGGGESPSEPELTVVEDEVVEEDVDEPSEEAPEDAEDEDEEDVLEETPDFLRETPEHDRLWFEQKPPKDFDFDE